MARSGATGGGKGTTRDIHGWLHIKGQSREAQLDLTVSAPARALGGMSNDELRDLVGMTDAAPPRSAQMPAFIEDWTDIGGGVHFASVIPRADIPETNISIEYANSVQDGDTVIGTDGPGWYVVYNDETGDPLSYGTFDRWPRYDTLEQAKAGAFDSDNLERLALAHDERTIVRSESTGQ